MFVKDCEIWSPASPPCILVGLPDVSQCFHGVLETQGDPLICSRHTNTHTVTHPLILNPLYSLNAQLHTNVKLVKHVEHISDLTGAK